MEDKIAGTGTQPVDLAVLFSGLVRLETNLWGLVDQRLRREHELPLSWFEPMQVMDRVPDCRVADIAQALSITVGGASKLVDRIEHAGWCGRAPNPSDARSSVLTISHAGRRVLDTARDAFDDELTARLGATVSPERLAEFAATVRDLRSHIPDHPESAR
jgi:DNA-binding MarR family transcriptional regulator